MSKNLIIVAVIAIVAIGGIVFFAGGKSTQIPTSVPTEAVQQENPPPTEVMEKKEEAKEKEKAMEKTSVEIKNFAFGPKSLTIKKGTGVTFTNQDSVKHSATADDGSFDTGLLAKGESASVTFDEVGVYTYHCTPHPNMKATIIVE